MHEVTSNGLINLIIHIALRVIDVQVHSIGSYKLNNYPSFHLRTTFAMHNIRYNCDANTHNSWIRIVKNRMFTRIHVNIFQMQ